MKIELDEFFLTTLGFITSFMGLGAVYGSFRVEFWLDLAETIRFMVVFLLYLYYNFHNQLKREATFEYFCYCSEAKN